MSPEPQTEKSTSTRTPLVRRPWFKRLRYSLIPARSQKEHELWMMVKSARERRYLVALVSAFKLILYIITTPLQKRLEPAGAFAGEPYFQDNSRVVLYTQESSLFPDYQPRRSLRPNSDHRVPVSLITTLKNEKDTVVPWLESLAGQTRPPDEVVIVDGGSTDGTLQILEEFAQQYPLPLKLISEPGANVARGRNIAVTHASHDVIACVDLGCHLDSNWLERITYPFEDDPDMQVVGGWSDSVKTSKIKMLLLGIKLADVNPQSFMPSSRSIAFTKAAWEKVCGYPEWIRITGEDTFFNIELKKACRHWAFVPEAIVWWEAPDGISTYWRKLRHWATGDGEALSNASLYWHSLTRLIFLAAAELVLLILLGWAVFDNRLSALIAAVIFLVGSYLLAVLSFSANVTGPRDLVSELGAEVARVQGFLFGAKRRPVSLAQRYQGVRGFFFIMAGVPIDDTGGGARCTQIALELLRQGYAVFYINRFPKYESVELDLIIYHPQLYATPLSHFRWKAFQRNYMGLFEGRPVGALVEFPLREFLPIIKDIRRSGGMVAYDLLDDWDSSLGGSWYSPEAEKEIIANSQLLIATENSLAERLEKLGQRPASLIPNAVNSRLFDPGMQYPRPDDFPEGDWSIIYVGSLWGDWFDWNLLTGIARQYPQAPLLVIGDYRGQCAEPPPNLHFLRAEAPACSAGLSGSCFGSDHPLDGQPDHPGNQPAESIRVHRHGKADRRAKPEAAPGAAGSDIGRKPGRLHRESRSGARARTRHSSEMAAFTAAK